MPCMLFSKELINLILAGKKTMTSRDKPQFQVGDLTILMANKDYSKISGKCIKFTKIYSKLIGAFNEKDAHKEGFATLVDLKEYWKKNVGQWKDETIIYIHEFELIDYDPSLFVHTYIASGKPSNKS